MQSTSFFALGVIATLTFGCGKRPPEPTNAPTDAAATVTTSSNDDASSTSASTSATDAAASSPGRPKATSTIEKGVAALRPKLVACWRASLEKNPKEAGSAHLELQIAADGGVRDAKLEPSPLSNATIDCIRDTARAHKFEPLGKDSTIVVPLTFPPPTLRIRSGDGGAGGAMDGGAP